MAAATGLNCHRIRPENTQPWACWRRERNWDRTFSGCPSGVSKAFESRPLGLFAPFGGGDPAYGATSTGLGAKPSTARILSQPTLLLETVGDPHQHRSCCFEFSNKDAAVPERYHDANNHCVLGATIGGSRKRDRKRSTTWLDQSSGNC